MTWKRGRSNWTDYHPLFGGKFISMGTYMKTVRDLLNIRGAKSLERLTIMYVTVTGDHLVF